MSGGYRCKECDLVFDTKKSYNAHMIFAHKTTSPSVKKILILGGGFSGLNVVQQIQKTKFSLLILGSYSHHELILINLFPLGHSLILVKT